ncbi:hypothetical protein [Clostridium botulinum]|uniref:hypothetical protein n=1 Tax=Clostridium botulinum TaxID=1491 RepID=UPI00174D3653|nr:hypothetical protein [Clostridium botulinum]MBD5589171.1 hypothetical protein [Clostridium botulinum]
MRNDYKEEFENAKKFGVKIQSNTYIVDNNNGFDLLLKKDNGIQKWSFDKNNVYFNDRKICSKIDKDNEKPKKHNDVKQRPINITINIDGKKDNNKLSKAINTSFTLEGFDSLSNKVKNLLNEVKGEN